MLEDETWLAEAPSSPLPRGPGGFFEAEPKKFTGLSRFRIHTSVYVYVCI